MKKLYDFIIYVLDKQKKFMLPPRLFIRCVRPKIVCKAWEMRARRKKNGSVKSDTIIRYQNVTIIFKKLKKKSIITFNSLLIIEYKSHANDESVVDSVRLFC